uniref:NADH dehydrogenase subunit 6 n=1 Tax=Typhlocyba choui TaxID=2893151 RepID=A0A9E7BYI5_9HEMI|nr:NADH dehydrogenase subunit 6 [Typhlocyba choui]UGN61404.1 NADH dehydrogenase subunit 6 [Typhlocyba choui]
MKIMLIKLMIMWSSISMVMYNPMALGMILLVQTITVILFMNKILYSSWFTLITFMMMIGGLLIMFMYMTSIASNEKFSLKINLSIMILIVLIIFDEMMISNQIDETQEILKTNNFNLSLTKMFNNKSMLITMLLVLYLLLTMISVTSMVKHHKGPLRAIN